MSKRQRSNDEQPARSLLASSSLATGKLSLPSKWTNGCENFLKEKLKSGEISCSLEATAVENLMKKYPIFSRLKPKAFVGHYKQFVRRKLHIQAITSASILIMMTLLFLVMRGGKVVKQIEREGGGHNDSDDERVGKSDEGVLMMTESMPADDDMDFRVDVTGYPTLAAQHYKADGKDPGLRQYTILIAPPAGSKRLELFIHDDGMGVDFRFQWGTFLGGQSVATALMRLSLGEAGLSALEESLVANKTHVQGIKSADQVPTMTVTRYFPFQVQRSASQLGDAFVHKSFARSEDLKDRCGRRLCL